MKGCNWSCLLLFVVCYMTQKCATSADIQNVNLCTLSGCAPKDVSNTSVLYTACEKGSSYLSGRCCYHNATGTILGLDLTHCVIMDVDILQGDQKGTKGFERKDLEILLLDDNPLSDCDGKAFKGMTNLDYLSLPSVCSCPLGEDAWDNVNRTANETICEGNLCRKSGVTCPANSHCQMHNSTIPWCVCDEGYHGYKCLRQGTFPVIPFLAGIISATVGMSGLFWATSRRKARKLC